MKVELISGFPVPGNPLAESVIMRFFTAAEKIF
jgi:hypothetical protein